MNGAYNAKNVLQENKKLENVSECSFEMCKFKVVPGVLIGLLNYKE